jgi:hypothetical protein
MVGKAAILESRSCSSRESSGFETSTEMRISSGKVILWRN